MAKAVPVFLYDAEQAADAFEAYQAIRQHEREYPLLAENPFWRALSKIALANFEDVYLPQVEVHQ